MEQHLARPRNKHFRQQVIGDLEEIWGNQSPPIIGERKNNALATIREAIAYVTYQKNNSPRYRDFNPHW